MSENWSVASLDDAMRNKDFRLDAEFWTHRPRVNENLTYLPIADLLIESAYGTSRAMESDASGIPTYRMNEIDDLLCDAHPEKYVDEYYLDQSMLLRYRDVLFNRTNSMDWVGRTAIYLHRDGVRRSFASYLVALRVDERALLPEVLAAYLGSSEGRRELRRRARPSVNQANINPEEVKAIKMPVPSSELQGFFRLIFAEAHELEIKGQLLIEQAFQSVALSAGDDLPDDHAGVSMLSLLDRNGRWDAEFTLASTAEERVVGPRARGVLLSDVAVLKDTLTLPLPDGEYRYIQLADIDPFGRIRDVPSVKGVDLPSRARRRVSAGDVIISSVQGSIDRCALVPEKYDGAFCSTGFHVLRAKDGLNGWLFALMKSKPVRKALSVSATGSILSAYSAASLMRTLLPLPGNTGVALIHEKVSRGLSMRDSARSTLLTSCAVFDLLVDDSEAAAKRLAASLLGRLQSAHDES